MSKKRISETEAQAVLSGRAPEGRDDLADVAAAISGIRASAFETTARPSTELASRMDLAAATRISPAQATPSGKPVMGLAARIALGVGAVFGATVFATAGAGAAGVLPGPAQEAFDTVVSTVLPGLGYGSTVFEGTPSPEPFSDVNPEHPDTFGGDVSERAKDPGKDGATFGVETSEAAQENGETTPPVEPGEPAVPGEDEPVVVPPTEDPGQGGGNSNGNGNSDGNGAPTENPGNGQPTDPGQPGDPGKPTDPGKPDFTGSPGSTGQPEGTGKPDVTGKPDGTPGGKP